eukprot:4828534-Prymnesium_polylepis.1
MDLAQRGAANSPPRAAKRDSMSRCSLALAAALGICAMSGILAGRSTVRNAGTPESGQVPTVGKP